jgi:4-hydroxyphenylpyruvate dioxygenase
VKVAALWVEDASAYQETMKRGARSFMEPTKRLAKWFVQDLYLRRPFMFVERKIIRVFSPGYKEWKSDYNPEPGLKYIDHMVGWVGKNTWVKFYEEVMGFKISFLF